MMQAVLDETWSEQTPEGASAQIAPSKRDELKQIVLSMGKSATPAEIREQAYKVGFGAVNSQMLIYVRNELWPNRTKHAGGNAKGISVESSFIAPDGFVDISICQICGGKTKTHGTNTNDENGMCTRTRKCKSCGHKIKTVDSIAGRRLDYRRILAMAATEKRCSKCKLIKPVSDFGKRANDTTLLRPACKKCLNEYRAKSGLQKVLAGHGLSNEQYEAMLEKQNGLCAICQMPQTAKRRYRLSIDHCHESGKVRGLLCDKCNTGIGNLRDDPTILNRALAYVLHHQTSDDVA